MFLFFCQGQNYTVHCGAERVVSPPAAGSKHDWIAERRPGPRLVSGGPGMKWRVLGELPGGVPDARGGVDELCPDIALYPAPSIQSLTGIGRSPGPLVRLCDQLIVANRGPPRQEAATYVEERILPMVNESVWADRARKPVVAFDCTTYETSRYGGAKRPARTANDSAAWRRHRTSTTRCRRRHERNIWRRECRRYPSRKAVTSPRHRSPPHGRPNRRHGRLRLGVRAAGGRGQPEDQITKLALRVFQKRQAIGINTGKQMSTCA